MKDRLAELNASRTQAEEDVAVAVDRDGFMESFFRKVEEVRGLIDKISYQVEEVRKMHSMILSAPNPDDRTKDQLNSLTNDIKGNANVVRTKLKTMELSMPRDDAANRSSVDFRIQKTQVRKQTTDSCPRRSIRNIRNIRNIRKETGMMFSYGFIQFKDIKFPASPTEFTLSHIAMFSLQQHIIP